MIKRIFIFLMLGLMAMIFFNIAANYNENTTLSKLGHYYADKGPQELGAPNLVTAVVVTYRGLDTLGEVTVLFISAAGVGLLLRRTRRNQDDDKGLEQGDRAEETAGVHKPASEIDATSDSEKPRFESSAEICLTMSPIVASGPSADRVGN